MTRRIIERNMDVLMAKGMVQFPNRNFKQRVKSYVIEEANDKVSMVLESGFGLNTQIESRTFKISEADNYLQTLFKSFKEGMKPEVAPKDEPEEKVEVKKVKTIGDVRETLFATLSALRANTMEVERAKAISAVSQTILNSAKIEMEYKKLTGKHGGIMLLEA